VCTLGVLGAKGVLVRVSFAASGVGVGEVGTLWLGMEGGR
jgi:hypothetical protein